MNDKELFRLFLKYSNIVISRYKELTLNVKRYTNLSFSKMRKDFEEELQSSKDFIDKEIKNSGYINDGYRYSFPNYYFYFGKQGWNKYGVFSFIPLYKQAKWNISVIEKYKENIVWAMLFEYGDFFFEEEILSKYEQYIPWVDYSEGNGKFIPFFDNGVTIKRGTTLSNFKNVGTLSESFIKSHITVIDIWGLCSTGSFKVTKELVKLFCESCSNNIVYDFREEYGGLACNNRISISSDILLYIAKTLKINNWERLLPKITLTSKSFLDFYLYAPLSMEVFFKLEFDKRREIVSFIEHDRKLRRVIDSDFCKRLWQGGDNRDVYLKFLERGRQWCAEQEYCEKEGFEGLKNLPYTYDFSIELIKKNILSWNKQSFEYFSGMKRTSDINYHYYKRITAWDMLSMQDSILLTYDLCKFLISLDVVVGGSYVLEDDSYHTDDVPNHPINALKLFQIRNVTNNEEFVKIVHDKVILEFLFANVVIPPYPQNHYIIDKLIINFFEDFSFKEFEYMATEKNS